MELKLSVAGGFILASYMKVSLRKLYLEQVGGII
jgi:hypothetical protein